MAEPKLDLDPEARAFSEAVPDRFVDLLLDPPAEWGTADPPAPAPVVDSKALRTAKAKRARSLARYPWGRPEMHYRVHFYEKTKRGTWHRYFAQLDEAQAFAVGKPLWGEPAVVETKPATRAT